MYKILEDAKNIAEAEKRRRRFTWMMELFCFSSNVQHCSIVYVLCMYIFLFLNLFYLLLYRFLAGHGSG